MAVHSRREQETSRRGGRCSKPNQTERRTGPHRPTRRSTRPPPYPSERSFRLAPARRHGGRLTFFRATNPSNRRASRSNRVAAGGAGAAAIRHASSPFPRFSARRPLPCTSRALSPPRTIMSARLPSNPSPFYSRRGIGGGWCRRRRCLARIRVW